MFETMFPFMKKGVKNSNFTAGKKGRMQGTTMDMVNQNSTEGVARRCHTRE